MTGQDAIAFSGEARLIRGKLYRFDGREHIGRSRPFPGDGHEGKPVGRSHKHMIRTHRQDDGAVDGRR